MYHIEVVEPADLRALESVDILDTQQFHESLAETDHSNATTHVSEGGVSSAPDCSTRHCDLNIATRELSPLSFSSGAPLLFEHMHGLFKENKII